MNTKRTKKVSKFMSDCTAGSRENVLDFQMSWVLRTGANLNEAVERPNLYKHCRAILLRLIGFEKEQWDSIRVTEVKVWKQWKKIDVLANVFIKINNKEERHVLLIEDKAYTNMSLRQRDVYPLIVKEEYDGYGIGNTPEDIKWRNYILHQYVITCFDAGDDNKDLEVFCKDTDWKVVPFVELLDKTLDTTTESDMFDDFWFTKWTLIPEKCKSKKY